MAALSFGAAPTIYPEFFMTAKTPAARGTRQPAAAPGAAPAETPADTPFVATEPGFLVDSLCGRQWFVPLTAVGRDYAEFLEQADGLSREEAQAQSDKDPSFWPTWFAEQCTHWEDVERLGRLVRYSTLFKTKAALDRRRSRSVEDYTEVGIPAEAGGTPE
jgi:hypothetical protein